MATDESSYMEPLQLAGQIIMENGGETYRVEETVTRMGRAFGLHEVESFAVPSGVFVSYRKTDGETECSLKRVHRGGTNLMRVNAVNAVSRQVEAGQLECMQALEKLRTIQTEKSPYSSLFQLGAAAVCAAGFSIMFHGGLMEFVLAAVVSAMAQWLGQMMVRYKMQALMTTLLESLVIALIPNLLHMMGMSFLVEAVIAGALMPLVPGLSMTNAVQDAMRGDMISAASHGLSAVLTAGLISGGTLAASALIRLMMGGGL